MHVLKLQRPIGGNGSGYEMLAYNEDRTIHVMQEITPEEQAEIFGDDLKIYAKADIRPDGFVDISSIKRTKPRSW